MAEYKPDTLEPQAGDTLRTSLLKAVSILHKARTGETPLKVQMEVVGARVRFATTGNDTLTGLAARDGVTPIAGDEALVKSQTATEENGIYVAAAGAWARAGAFDAFDEHPGAVISVQEGSTNADRIYVCVSNKGGTLGSDPITFTQYGPALIPSNNLSDLASAATARTNLGLAIGTDVQAYDADLTTWADVTPGAGVAAALAADADAAGGFVTATAPYNAGNATGSVTLNFDNGALQYCVLTGNAEFQVPTGTPVEAKSEIVVVVQDGGGFTLDFAAGVQRASDSAATFPKTLTDNKSYIFKLRYMGGKWCLVSLVGGFTIA